MKLATTTYDFARYCDSYKEAIKLIHEAGFRYIDLSLDTIRDWDNGILIGDDWKKGVQEIKDAMDEYGMQFAQAHACSRSNYYFPPNTPKEEIKQNRTRSIEVCGELGIKNMVLHGQLSRELSTTLERAFELNRKHLLEELPLCEEYGVNILVENGPKKHYLETFYTDEKIENPKYLEGWYDAKILKDFIKYMDHPLIHACWDTGHANMNGYQYDEIKTLGDDLYGLHVHDNYDENDSHSMPYFGTLSLDDLMKALIDVNYKGFFTFEACNSLGSENYYVTNRKKIEGENKLFKPSLELKMIMEKFMYQVGKDALMAYNCFEE